MRFSYREDTEIYAGELMYIAKDISLYYEPFCTQTGFSVMISGAYTSLDVDYETGEAKHISGCNPRHLWQNKQLKKPASIHGKLFVIFDSPVFLGSGEYYARDWLTYYDQSEGMICIGNPGCENYDICIEFAKNIYAALQGDQLIAVWAKIKEM